jgi:hypothetical protein
MRHVHAHVHVPSPCPRQRISYACRQRLNKKEVLFIVSKPIGCCRRHVILCGAACLQRDLGHSAKPFLDEHSHERQD